MPRAILVGGGAFSPALLPEPAAGDLLLAADSGNPWDAAVDYAAILNKFDPDRHQGRANIAFLDGHSATRRLADMPWGGSSEYRPLWKD